MPRQPLGLLVVHRAAVLGRPIEHSLSPVLHRGAYGRSGSTGRTRRSTAAWTSWPRARRPRAEWAGFSCTMPLKHAALEVADETCERARRVGAANTLLRAATGWSPTTPTWPASSRRWPRRPSARRARRCSVRAARRRRCSSRSPNSAWRGVQCWCVTFGEPSSCGDGGARWDRRRPPDARRRRALGADLVVSTLPPAPPIHWRRTPGAATRRCSTSCTHRGRRHWRVRLRCRRDGGQRGADAAAPGCAPGRADDRAPGAGRGHARRAARGCPQLRRLAGLSGDSGRLSAVDDKDGLPVVGFDSAADWEAWLTEQHAESRGAWIRIAKAGNSDAQRQLRRTRSTSRVSFGWIDGQRSSLDEHGLPAEVHPARGRAAAGRRSTVERAERVHRAGPDASRRSTPRWSAPAPMAGGMPPTTARRRRRCPTTCRHALDAEPAPR